MKADLCEGQNRSVSDPAAVAAFSCGCARAPPYGQKGHVSHVHELGACTWSLYMCMYIYIYILILHVVAVLNVSFFPAGDQTPIARLRSVRLSQRSLGEKRPQRRRSHIDSRPVAVESQGCETRSPRTCRPVRPALDSGTSYRTSAAARQQPTKPFQHQS